MELAVLLSKLFLVVNGAAVCLLITRYTAIYRYHGMPPKMLKTPYFGKDVIVKTKIWDFWKLHFILLS